MDRLRREVPVPLGEIEVASLPPARQLDHLLLRLLLEGALFDLKELRELESNPMSYVLIPTLLTYLTREYAPAADRVAAIEQVLAGVPKLLEAGLQRLQPVLARPFVELAIAIGEGLPSHFQDAQTFADKESTELGRRLSVAREAASSAVLGFIAALRTEYFLGPRMTSRSVPHGSNACCGSGRASNVRSPTSCTPGERTWRRTRNG